MKKFLFLIFTIIPLLAFSQGEPKVEGIEFIPIAQPSSPDRGDLYYDSTSETLFVWNGSSWLDLSAGGVGAVASVNGLVGTVTLDLDLTGNTLSLTGDGTTVDLSGLNQTASQVSITDSGGFYTGTDVEAALQEIAGGGGGGGTDDQIASEVPFTPAGDISATDVQAALEEADAEKVKISTVSPESNISIASGTGAQLDALLPPSVGEVRIEVATNDLGDIATDFYVESINISGAFNKTLTLTRSGLPDLSVAFDAGDMLSSVYDIDVNNVVDNSESLGGVPATNYLRSDQSDTFNGNLSITGTVDGRDLSTDGAKLDGIESGATADQNAPGVPIIDSGGYFTGTDVEAALQEIGAGGIGGGGSGDMTKAVYDTDNNSIVDNSEALGGVAATNYLRSDQSDTFNGNLSITGTVDGRDVAADGSKLDNIEPFATADQNADEMSISDSGNYFVSGTVEGALQEVGANKGDMFKSTYDTNTNNIVDLSENAQNLDGINSPSFLRSDQNDSFTASLFTISNGSLNVTTSSRTASLSGTQLTFGSSISTIISNTGGGTLGLSTDNNTGTTTNRLLIGQGAAQVNFDFQDNNIIDVASLDVNGNIDAGGDITAFSSSDKRLKYNMKPIKNPIKKIQHLSGYDFQWKGFAKMLIGKEGKDVGVMAQEVERVIPEATRTGYHGYKQVDYEKIIPLLIEAVKEQQEEIEELKNEIKRLKKNK